MISMPRFEGVVEKKTLNAEHMERLMTLPARLQLTMFRIESGSSGNAEADRSQIETMQTG